MRDIVKASQNKFVQKAVKDEGLSEREARRQAEKLIGVTWDVGHINMLKKYGFENKDVIKETQMRMEQFKQFQKNQMSFENNNDNDNNDDNDDNSMNRSLGYYEGVSS